MYLFIYVCIYICIYTYMRMYVYTPTHKQTNKHTNTHTHTHTCPQTTIGIYKLISSQHAYIEYRESQHRDVKGDRTHIIKLAPLLLRQFYLNLSNKRVASHTQLFKGRKAATVDKDADMEMSLAALHGLQVTARIYLQISYPLACRFAMLAHTWLFYFFSASLLSRCACSWHAHS